MFAMRRLQAVSNLKPRSTALDCTLWLAALLLAACETWIDFDARPGLNWSLSVLATAGLFAAFSRMRNAPWSWPRMLPLLGACTLACAAAITASAFIDGLVLIGTPALLALTMLSSNRRNAADQFGMSDFLLAPLRAAADILREARRRIGEALGYAGAESSLPFLRGIAMAAPVTLVFGLLLSGADPVLAHWRDTLIQAIRSLSFLGRVSCFVAFGVASLGALGIALTAAEGSDRRSQLPSDPSFVLGNTERRIVLCAVICLFGVFLLLQASRLFGNAAAISGNGVTYAETAHQGFVELTIVSSLCAALLIALTKSSVSRRLHAIERSLSLAVVLQTQLLLVSAFSRMCLYEDAYGFTELRFLVQVYIGVVAIGLAALALEMLALPDFSRLAQRCAATVFIALLALVYWNHAGWIAQANFRRYERTGNLDIPYAAFGLSPDAIPEIVDYLPRLPLPMRAQLRSCLLSAYGSDTQNNAASLAWYERSYRRSRLQSAIHQLTVETGADIIKQSPDAIEPLAACADRST
jgi:hypothetical protein